MDFKAPIMATGKNKIVVYSDWIDSFENLTDEEAGQLIKHFFRFVNDKDPILEDRVLKASWIPIEKTLKRDLKKWSDTIEKRSLAGKASAEARKQIEHMSTHVESVEHNSTKSTVSVNDSVSVNVSDSVSVNDIKKEKKEIFNFRKSLVKLGFDNDLVVDWLKVRKNKKASNTQTAFSAIENQVNFSDLDINRVLKMHVEKSWSGFKIKWYENELLESKENKNGKQNNHNGNVSDEFRAKQAKRLGII